MADHDPAVEAVYDPLCLLGHLADPLGSCNGGLEVEEGVVGIGPQLTLLRPAPPLIKPPNVRDLACEVY